MILVGWQLVKPNRPPWRSAWRFSNFRDRRNKHDLVCGRRGLRGSSGELCGGLLQAMTDREVVCVHRWETTEGFWDDTIPHKTWVVAKSYPHCAICDTIWKPDTPEPQVVIGRLSKR